MEKEPIQDVAHKHWQRIISGVEKHEAIDIEPGVQAFFTKPPKTKDPEAMIKHIQEWREKGFDGYGTNINVDHWHNKLLPVKEHLEQNPYLADEKFKKDFETAMKLLEDHRGKFISTLTKGTMDENEIREVAYHELAHGYFRKFWGMWRMDSSKIEDVRSDEGLAAYLAITRSGSSNGQKFRDVIQQYKRRPERWREYGEPALMYHELISRGETIDENIVDGEKLKQVMERIKNGESIDQIHSESE